MVLHRPIETTAVTGHVGTSTNLSGYPTVRPLGGVLASGM